LNSIKDKIEKAKRLQDWETVREEKKLLAESMIPEKAKRLYKKDFKEYKNSLIAGWLCDNQCIIYGICKSANSWHDSLSVPNYSLCVTWEPTIEETITYLGNNKLVSKFKKNKIL